MRSEFQTSGVRRPAGRINAHRVRSNSKALLSAMAGICLIVWNLPVLSADDYLSELDAEAKKVEAHEIGAEEDGNIADVPAAKTSRLGKQDYPNASRKAFERQLKEHYLGSYGFYRKLPERSREEVFQEYRQGADMDQLRKKIINRLLQH